MVRMNLPFERPKFKIYEIFNQHSYYCKKIVCENDNHFTLIDALADKENSW